MRNTWNKCANKCDKNGLDSRQGQKKNGVDEAEHTVRLTHDRCHFQTNKIRKMHINKYLFIFIYVRSSRIRTVFFFSSSLFHTRIIRSFRVQATIVLEMGENPDSERTQIYCLEINFSVFFSSPLATRHWCCFSFDCIPIRIVFDGKIKKKNICSFSASFVLVAAHIYIGCVCGRAQRHKHR